MSSGDSQELRELRDNHQRLEERLRSIETNFKVGLLVAAILGIGGGWVGTLITSAKAEIEGLESRTKKIEDIANNVEAAVTKASSQAIAEAKQQISQSAQSEVRAAIAPQLAPLKQQLESVSSEALRQCQVEIKSIWADCGPAQKDNTLPAVRTSLTPLKGGYSEWSEWQITSEWNGSPWNCVALRLYCK